MPHSNDFLHHLSLYSGNHLKSIRLRGRMFHCRAMACSSFEPCFVKSVLFDRYWREQTIAIPVAAVLPRAVWVPKLGRNERLSGSLTPTAHD